MRVQVWHKLWLGGNVRWQPLGFVLLALLLGGVVAWLPLAQVGLLFVTTAVFLLLFVQPLLGLGVALLLGPLGAWESLVWGATVLDSGQLFLLLALLAWLARGLRNGRLFLPHTPLNLPLALFLFVTVLTLIGAPSLLAGLRELSKWIEIALIMLLLVAAVQDRALTRPQLVWGAAGFLLLAGLSQAALGVWQFMLRGDGPDHFLINGRFYRAFGTFMQPNPYGGFVNLMALLGLGILLGLLLAAWQQWRSQRRLFWPQWLPLVVLLPLVGVLLLGLVGSWSRGAWLGFAAGGGAMLFFLPRRRWQGVVLLVALTAVLLIGFQLNLIPTSIASRLTSFGDDLRLGDVRGVDVNDSNYAVIERLAHWQAALEMGREQLWLGVGFGNYEAAYADHALINWPDALGHAHNYYLNLLAEVGMVGLLCYGLLWTAVLRQTIRLLAYDWPQRGIVLGLLAVWVGLSIHHLVDKLYVNNIYIHIGVMFGVLQLLDPKTES